MVTLLQDFPASLTFKLIEIILVFAGSKPRVAVSNLNWTHCDLCNYEAENVFFLKRHKQSQHGLVLRFPCDQCEYVATTDSDFNFHKITIHKGTKYICDQCEYVAKYKSYLKRHKQRKHGNIKYQL